MKFINLCLEKPFFMGASIVLGNLFVLIPGLMAGLFSAPITAVLLLAIILSSLNLSLFYFLLRSQLHRSEAIAHATLNAFKSGDRHARIPSDHVQHYPTLKNSINELLELIQSEEQRLTEKRVRYKSLIEMMADGLITVQVDGTIESVNSAGQKLLGYSQDELIGMHLSEVTTDKRFKSAQTHLDSFVEHLGDKNQSSETEVKTKNGEAFPIRLSVSKMRTQGKELYIGVLSDISAMKSMEKQLRTLNLALSKTNQDLAKTSITDSLTQLYNRRHFDITLSKELQRTTRQRSSLSLIVVDIDFFKPFNDIYGHAAGDEGIRQVAATIKRIFKRSGDMPARYGGEEFSIILPGCDGLELQERAETLRDAIHQLKIPHSGSRADDNLTVSIGAVTYKPLSREVVAPKPKEIFSEADKALYRAKANGRNQVVFAGHYQPLSIPSATGHFYGQLISR